MTKTEWTEQTWNPIVGCSIVSPGCTNCYAMRMAARLEAMAGDGLDDNGYGVRGTGPLDHYRRLTKPSKAGPVWTGKMAQAPEATLLAPLRRKKPTKYFVNSMSDLFHEDVPDEWIDRVFAVMALTPQHTFQVLTKRSARMREYVSGLGLHHSIDRVSLAAKALQPDGPGFWYTLGNGGFHIPNVWLGVSAERQQEADARIPDLLATPAAVRFVSAEPLLGPIDFTFVGNAAPVMGNVRYNALTGHALPYDGVCGGVGVWATNKAQPCAKLDWIIVGGESGPNARPMHPDWVRDIRDQSKGLDDAVHMLGLPDVAFFFKQWGEWQPVRSDPSGAGDGGKCYWPADSVDPSNDITPMGRDVATSWVAARPHSNGQLVAKVGKARAGRLLDGREWSEYPASSNVIPAKARAQEKPAASEVPA